MLKRCVGNHFRRFLCSQHIAAITEPNECKQLESQEKCLRVAVIGLPNAGKSTLINSLMDRAVCPVSSKAHTTRMKAKAVFTHENTQIVFMDNPGLVHPKEVEKFKLEKSFVKDSKHSLQEADVIGIIHDVSNHYTRDKLDNKIIDMLETVDEKEKFLVLNKIDLLKSKRKLLDVIRNVTEGHLRGVMMPNAKISEEIRGYKNFSEIFLISALTGSGLKDLRKYLIKQAKPRAWMFPDDVWSDQTPEKIIIDTVKAQLLNYLPQEIPYRCKPQMEFLDIGEQGAVSTVVLVKCPTARVAKLIAGDNDGRLKQIIESVQNNLQNAFHNFVRINIVLESPSAK